MTGYNRRISNELLELLKTGGALALLVDVVQQDAQARLEFRPKDNVHLYRGRTAVLRVRLLPPKHAVEFSADNEYERLSPDLFGQHPLSDLRVLGPALRAHLITCQSRVSACLVTGEAEPHIGLMRRYGLLHDGADPLLAVDSEVRMGFANAEARNLHEAELRHRMKLGPADKIPQKLDTLGVLPNGDLAFVEVKDAAEGLGRAAIQVAAHLEGLGRLDQRRSLSSMVNRLIVQKIACGLLPAGTLRRAASVPEIRPIVAAPDDREDWRAIWEAQIKPAAEKLGRIGVRGLHLWKLSRGGVIEQEETL